MNIIPTAQFLGPSPLKIGNYYQGGIIAYLGGGIPNGGTGFVVSTDWMPSGDGLGYTWGLYDDVVAGATGSVIGTGLSNSQYISDAYGGDPQYASVQALSYTAAGFDDWFLPSEDELQEVCFQFRNGNLNNGNWVNDRFSWSSTPRPTQPDRRAIPFDIRVGQSLDACNGTFFQKNTKFQVRPIRYFTYDINNPYENVYAQY
jgi:hypothetical protein